MDIDDIDMPEDVKQYLRECIEDVNVFVKEAQRGDLYDVLEMIDKVNHGKMKGQLLVAVLALSDVYKQVTVERQN